MNDTHTLILAGDGYKLSVAPEAEKMKADLIIETAAMTAVKTPDESIAARDLLKKLAAMRSAVEKSRTEVKAPVLKVGKDIDQVAADFIQGVLAEENRIKRLQEAYAHEVERERLKQAQELEAKRRAEAAAAAEAEKARIAAEKEAEDARIAAEKAEWEGSDESKAEAAEAAKAAAEKQRLAAEAAKAAEASRSEVTITPTFEAPKGVKFALDYEVLDLALLHKQRPELVKVEVRHSNIIGFLKSFNPDSPTLESDLAKIGLKPVKKAIVSSR